MTLVRRSGPFGDLASLRRAMDRLFEENFVSSRPWNLGDEQFVAMDIYASDDEVIVQAVLPGVRPEDVDITVEGSTLTISGDTTRTANGKEGSPVLQEIRRGRFMRTLSLPAGLEPDKATATFEDGMLTLRLPRAEQLKPSRIRIATDGKRDQREPVEAR